MKDNMRIFTYCIKDRNNAIIATSTGSNKKEAENGIISAYKIAGETPPKKIVWCGSPMSQGLTRAIVFGLLKAIFFIQR